MDFTKLRKYFFLFFFFVLFPLLTDYVIIGYSFIIANEANNAINIINWGSTIMIPQSVLVGIFVLFLVLPSFLSWFFAKMLLSQTKSIALGITRKTFRKMLDYYRWIYFLLSVAGAITAAYYVQTGTLMAVNGIIGDRLLGRLNSYLEKKWEAEEIAENQEKIALQGQNNQVQETRIEIPTHFHHN